MKVDDQTKPILITGGAGFIGTNLARRLLERGQPVVLLDNLSRPGVKHNVYWLRRNYGDRMRFVQSDVRDFEPLRSVINEVSRVYHFAAQVAVTSSVKDPLADFETNVRGTLNVLEAIRKSRTKPSLLFTSSNKVYGGLSHVDLEISGDRYVPKDRTLSQRGVSEFCPLDFHSPYGCSKGAAEQYVLDYARTYGLRTIVFRMSCIYGPRQFGTEDQGWVAHFLIQAMRDKMLTVYGDGRQVRDVLFVDDLVDAMELAQDNIEQLSGNAFNMGGGPEMAVSIRGLLRDIERLLDKEIRVQFESWRIGDQRYYVSDTTRFSAFTGWSPKHTVEKGLSLLKKWVENLQAGRSRQPAQQLETRT